MDMDSVIDHDYLYQDSIMMAELTIRLMLLGVPFGGTGRLSDYPPSPCFITF
jgi:hypothetical protein